MALLIEWVIPGALTVGAGWFAWASFACAESARTARRRDWVRHHDHMRGSR